MCEVYVFYLDGDMEFGFILVVKDDQFCLMVMVYYGWEGMSEGFIDVVCCIVLWGYNVVVVDLYGDGRSGKMF